MQRDVGEERRARNAGRWARGGPAAPTRTSALARARGRAFGVGLATALVLALGLGAVRAVSASAEEAWGPDEVARVSGQPVTRRHLERAAIEHLGPQLRHPESAASRVLDRVVEELAAEAACRERRLEVPEAEVAASEAELDAAARRRTGGAEGLEELLRRQGTNRDALRARLRHELRRRALREAGVDVEALAAAAAVRCRLPSARWGAASDLPGGTFLVVASTALSDREFGARLVSMIGAARAGEVLDKECRTLLIAAAGLQLRPEDMGGEIRRLKELQPLEARFDPEPVWEQVTLAPSGAESRDDERTDAELLASPYARSLFGLARRFREEATGDEVRRAWAFGADALYGPHVWVVDVEIAFSGAADVFRATPARTRAEALVLARRLLAEVRDGAAFADAAARLRRAGGSGIHVREARLYRTDRGRLLLEHALRLPDGAAGGPYETLSEVHVLRRVGLVPAPAFEEVEPLVRERLARERARTWLEDRMSDPEHVEIRWP